ncbi:MAG: 30S ribosomal protein S2 [Candidatus Delongbacteria bacterium]|nr:30S ribosomal protein S2 [Candidatus Delongbacteria bacterium]MDD4205045.1 30S ribosomal protein S2 [Candidatus Delongbacteria bacterium]MDY0017600.1 30S ribosomal protein S2 [Candidatus Delongbacteria bacterium]
MPRVSVQQLLLAGSHFGHLSKRWNPKMRPYIFTKKKGIHLIDLNKTAQMIDEACDAAMKIVAKRGKILFVGTKAQAKDLLKEEAVRCGMNYVTERWLGGFLTNFQTIRNSIRTLEELERKATDGTYQKINKREKIVIEKDKEKLNNVLEGVRTMKVVPNAIFVVDTIKETIAIKEAKKLNIPVFAICDTNSDVDDIDYIIPANDDAFKSIGLITKVFSDSILEASQVANIKAGDEGRVQHEDTEAAERKRVPKRPLRKTVEKEDGAEEPQAEKE